MEGVVHVFKMTDIWARIEVYHTVILLVNNVMVTVVFDNNFQQVW